MKKRQFIILLSAIFIVLVTLNSCSTYQDVTIEDISGIKVLSSSTEALDIEIQARINNPNFYDIDIVGYDFDVLLEQVKLGNAKSTDKITIPGNSNTNHSLPIHIKFDGILSGVAAFFTISSKSKVTVKITGTADVKAVLIDKQITINVEKQVDLAK